jgi:hypothetical protein
MIQVPSLRVLAYAGVLGTAKAADGPWTWDGTTLTFTPGIDRAFLIHRMNLELDQLSNINCRAFYQAGPEYQRFGTAGQFPTVMDGITLFAADISSLTLFVPIIGEGRHDATIAGYTIPHNGPECFWLKYPARISVLMQSAVVPFEAHALVEEFDVSTWAR